MAAHKTELGRVKGASIRGFMLFYEREVDPGAIVASARNLPEALAAEFHLERPDLGILHNRWYDAEAIHAVLDHLLAEYTREQREALAQRAGTAVVAHMQRGVYKVLFSWFLTPGRYTRIVEHAWKLNYDSGRVITTLAQPGRHCGRTVDWRGHHPFLCKTNVAIKAAIYTAMGCKNVRVESRVCRSDGDDACGSTIVWDTD